ncbi:MAG: cytochrome c [Deltaproteobacteria bacterium]|nr:cytochrome c [Deltaproteobacteria bacterium]MBI5049021.1 cytochrome c [Deltaproteobacteria bacterium]
MHRTGISAILLSLAIWGCATIPRVTDMEIQEAMKITGDPAVGRVVYEKNCIYCHREKGEGGGIASGTLEKSMSKRDEDLYRSIKQGMETWMPAFPKLSAKETVDVIAYVRELLRR